MLGYQIFLLDDELHLCDFNDSALAAAPSVFNSNRETRIAIKTDPEEIQNKLIFGASDLKTVRPPCVPSVDLFVNAASGELKSTMPNILELNATEKEPTAPLCKCTACEKSFHSLRKLYGHFGSTHSRAMGLKINTGDVLFACPFCKEAIFKPLPEVEAHVMKSHPGCQLTKSKYDTSPRIPKVIRTKSIVVSSSPQKKTPFKRHLTDFVTWFQQHPLPRHDSMNKELYSWCWRQCNGTAALLVGTPRVSGVKMNASKIKVLASNGFFRTFSYHDEKFVCEDEYEGSEEWDAAFNTVQGFSVSYGSTQIPEYHHCSPATRTWIADTHKDLLRFTRGQHCELSIHQIEKLILIGFCKDRSDLPNLTRSDVIWLKRFRELKQYQLLFGDCHVSEGRSIFYLSLEYDRHNLLVCMDMTQFSSRA
jgi:hypothetical protein